jgi:hypothetical protein
LTTMVTTMIRLNITTTTLLRPFESCRILDIPFPPKLTIKPVSFLSMPKGKRITKPKSIFKDSNRRQIEEPNCSENQEQTGTGADWRQHFADLIP